MLLFTDVAVAAVVVVVAVVVVLLLLVSAAAAGYAYLLVRNSYHNISHIF